MFSARISKGFMLKVDASYLSSRVEVQGGGVKDPAAQQVTPLERWLEFPDAENFLQVLKVERQVGFDEENDGADFEVVRNIRN
jgi:hypothetical protein